MAKPVTGNHHHVYFVNYKISDLAATLGYAPAGQPGHLWGANTKGAAFYSDVLAKQPATIQAAIDLGAQVAPRLYTKRVVLDHLRWLYTWPPFTFLTINGAAYVPPVAPAPTPVAPTPVPSAPVAPIATLIPASKAKSSKGK